MHETGIAQSILDIAMETAKNNGALKINTVGVRVGKMSAIDESSLRFAFDALKQDTIAGSALFEYEEVPLIGKCEECGSQSEMEGYFVKCKCCGSGKVKLISGNELEVAYIDID